MMAAGANESDGHRAIARKRGASQITGKRLLLLERVWLPGFPQIRLDLPVELVNLRAGVSGPRPVIQLERTAPNTRARPQHAVRMHGVDVEVAVYARDRLAAGQGLTGPALVTETVSTTYIAPGWECVSDGYGNLELSRGTV